jgi:autophagy-related protein 2
VACSSVGESKARALLSVGPLATTRTEDTELPLLLPRITVTKSTPSLQSSASRLVSTTALIVRIPSVQINISKPVLDSLQYLADDTAQLLERISGNETGNLKVESRDPSLIGSRFFAKSRSGSGGSGLSASSSAKSESAVKVEITEGKLANTR